MQLPFPCLDPSPSPAPSFPKFHVSNILSSTFSISSPIIQLHSLTVCLFPWMRVSLQLNRSYQSGLSCVKGGSGQYKHSIHRGHKLSLSHQTSPFPLILETFFLLQLILFPSHFTQFPSKHVRRGMVAPSTSLLRVSFHMNSLGIFFIGFVSYFFHAGKITFYVQCCNN